MHTADPAAADGAKADTRARNSEPEFASDEFWVDAPGGERQWACLLLQGGPCDRRLRCRLQGDRSAPIKVLALHGWGCSLELWDALPFLNGVRGDACVLAVDSRGAGRSSCGRGVWGIADHGEDVLRVLDAVGWAPPDTALVGISQGGMVAQHAMSLALRRGLGRFRAAVLINTLPPSRASLRPSLWLRLVAEGLKQQADPSRARRRAAHRALMTSNARATSSGPHARLEYAGRSYRLAALAGLVGGSCGACLCFSGREDHAACAAAAAEDIAPTEAGGGALMGNVSALLQDQEGPHVRGRLRGWLVNLCCAADHRLLQTASAVQGILAAAPARLLVVSSTADEVFPPANAARIASLYAQAGADVAVCPLQGRSHLPLDSESGEPVSEFLLRAFGRATERDADGGDPDAPAPRPAVQFSPLPVWR